MSVQAFNRLNQQAMILAVEAVHKDDMSLLAELGLSSMAEDEMTRLKSLNLSHLISTEAFRGALCEVKFNLRQLELFIDFASSKNTEDDLINQVIRFGLRQTMLEEIKGTGRRDFNARRKRMGMPEQAKGRIENLKEDDELTVLRAWKRLEKTISDPLERLLALHDETHISLDRAWLAIRPNDNK